MGLRLAGLFAAAVNAGMVCAAIWQPGLRPVVAAFAIFLLGYSLGMATLRDGNAAMYALICGGVFSALGGYVYLSKQVPLYNITSLIGAAALLVGYSLAFNAANQRLRRSSR